MGFSSHGADLFEGCKSERSDKIGWFTASPCKAANDRPIFHRTQITAIRAPPPMTDVTQMLRRWREGDPAVERE